MNKTLTSAILSVALVSASTMIVASPANAAVKKPVAAAKTTKPVKPVTTKKTVMTTKPVPAKKTK